MGNLSETLKALSDNAGLLAALGAVAYGVFRVVRALRAGYASFKAWLVDVIRAEIPAGVKSTLLNGGGAIVKQIVAEENRLQSVQHAAETARMVELAVGRHASGCVLAARPARGKR